jgi:NhaA family Na+:H+ antiporter
MPFRTFREFTKLESSGGIILFCAAVIALIIDNTSLHQYYQAFFHLPLTLKLGNLGLEKPLLLWINDGFMAIFFLLVGLEIKRELLEGELRTFSRAALPGVAAVGGMVVPALFYIALNYHDPKAIHGWAIPMATDIAFSLGILALLGKHIPISAKVFLTALAIFDDLGAIIVIAIFYTSKISLIMLLIAIILMLILYIFNRYNITRFAPYLLIGLVMWVCVLKSGIHATLTGIVVAFAIPLRKKDNPRVSPLRDLEHKLHPWVAFFILPVFAFANAGVSFEGLKPIHLISHIPLGIAGGLFIGKQVGIWGFTMLAVRFGVAKLPKKVTGLSIYGLSLLAGVGFTMSLFIGGLAFDGSSPEFSAYVRFGVLVGSVLSGIVGYFILRKVYHKPKI